MSIFQLSSTVPRGAKNADGSIDTFERDLGVYDSVAAAEAMAAAVLAKEIKDIQNLAFMGCPNLEEIVCEERGGGEGLSIGLMSFAACTRLCRVVLPTRLCGMGKGAFRDDGALAEFSVPKDHYPIVCENHLFDNCPYPDGKLAQLL